MRPIISMATAMMLMLATLSAVGAATLERIAERGAINVGFREDEPPMSFRDTDGAAVGYSIDLCDHIVTAIKQKLGRPDLATNHVPVTAETRFAAIESGEIDILCGATTKTMSRAERVGFTQLTFATGGSLLSLDDNKVLNVAGLNDRKVAVVSNTTTIDALQKALAAQLVSAEIIAIESAEDGMRMLDAGEIDAFASDQVVLIGQVIARQTEVSYFLSEQLFSFEPFALAIPRGDADFEHVANSALAQIHRSGRIDEIYRSWFGRFAENPPDLVLAIFQLGAIPE